MFYTYEDARDDIKIAKNNPTKLCSTPNNGGKILKQSRMSRSVVMLSNGFIIITFLFFVQIFFVLFNYLKTKSAKIPSVKIIGASICIIIQVVFVCVYF